SLRLGKLFIYASLFHDADTTDQAAAARFSRATGLGARAAAAMAFAEPELLQVGQATLRRWVQQEPRLAYYGHYVDQLERRRDHIRSAEVEELLGQLSDPFTTTRAIHSILCDADLVFRPARNSAGTELPVAQGTINALLANPDRNVRRSAWE